MANPIPRPNHEPASSSNDSTSTSSSSDDAIVAALAELAAAQAHLLATEHEPGRATPPTTSVADRNREIEEAHTQVLWAQAECLTARQADPKRERALEARVHTEAAVLTRFGFTSFGAYLHERSSAPTDDAQLEAARRAYHDAHQAFDQLAHERSTDSDSTSPLHIAALPAPPPPPPPPRPAPPTSGPASTSPTATTATPRRGARPVRAPHQPSPVPAPAATGPDPSPLAVLAAPTSNHLGTRDHRAQTVILATAAVVVLVVIGIVALSSRHKSDPIDAGLATAPTSPAPTSPAPTSPVTSRADAKTAPTTRSTPAPTKAPPATTTPASGSRAFCASVKVFAVTDMNALAANGVADPRAMAAAVDAFEANAPAEIATEAKALEPLTRKAIAAIQQGKVNSATGLQQWLAAAPPDELTTWIAAQQVVVPVIQQRCPGA